MHFKGRGCVHLKPDLSSVSSTRVLTKSFHWF
jgi:hypothetical protein